MASSEAIPILFLNPCTTLYGAETSLYLLIKHLDRSAFSPRVVLPDGGPLYKKLQALDVPVDISPVESVYRSDDSVDEAVWWLGSLTERVERLAELIEANDGHLVHSNVGDVLEGALAAKLTGRPHITTVRSNRFAHTLLCSLFSPANIHRTLNVLSQRIVAVSNSVGEALRPFIDAAKLQVIPNGVETDFFQPPIERPSPGSGHLQEETLREPRICTLSRVEREKGIHLLIEAAAIVVGDFPDARFSVMGHIQDEVYLGELQRLTESLKLADHVRFKGHTDQVREALWEADLLVVSSQSEGQSRVLLEAMAAGRPVVATRCGGTEEVIVDGATGYLVPPDDPEALAGAILKVLNDPEGAGQMGLRGLQHVRDHFAARRVSRRYEALYQEVLEGWTSRPTQDDDGSAVLISTVLEALDKYGGELIKMESQLRALRHFEARVKRSPAYKAYKAATGLKPRSGAQKSQGS